MKVSKISAEYLRGINLVTRYVIKVFPAVDKELRQWINLAKKIPDSNLRHQALASLEHKKFHAQGGSIYSLYPGAGFESTLKFIIAFQTISDYLDNLCDRAGVENEASFRQLHLAMLEAVDPEREIHDHYLSYPFKNDGDYLNNLVTECRIQLSKIPAYQLIRERIKKYIELYSDLQSFKHLSKSVRESLLSSWAQKYHYSYPEIYWWEFAAATGSTLAIFLLVAAASNSWLTPEEIIRIDAAYFPWICGLHILLDYYIDSEEDSRMGDLNFTRYYDNHQACGERLEFFIQQSMINCRSLPYPLFHLTIIRGLLAMYLSDKKALTTRNKNMTYPLLKTGGMETRFFHRCCQLLRSLNRL